jgi:hypothetical protein
VDQGKTNPEDQKVQEEEMNVPDTIGKPDSDTLRPGTSQQKVSESLRSFGEAKKRVFEINEASLEIRDWETEFAMALLPFIPTPRAAKRFTNIYRILKASVPKSELDSYEGTSKVPGTFQVPMVLLAVLTGIPEEAAEVFESLTMDLTGKTIQEVFLQVLKNKEEIVDRQFAQYLTRIISSESFPTDRELLAEWLPKVARFSFEVGRMFH